MCIIESGRRRKRRNAGRTNYKEKHKTTKEEEAKDVGIFKMPLNCIQGVICQAQDEKRTHHEEMRGEKLEEERSNYSFREKKRR